MKARAILTWAAYPLGQGDDETPLHYVAVARFPQNYNTWLKETWSLGIRPVDQRLLRVGDEVSISYIVETGPADWLTPGSEIELYEGSTLTAKLRTK